MPEDLRKKLIAIIKLVPLMVCGVLLVVCFVNRDKVTVDAILNHAPENLGMLSLVILALYAVKSITVVFPMLIINVAAGIVLPSPLALIINTVGVAVMSAIPYFIGRLSGVEIYEKFSKKYPKAREILDSRQNNIVFYSFFLRAINCLPTDIVSMCFGAIKADFPKYILGSVLGIFPGVVLATFMGKGIMEPGEPTFYVATAINVALSVVSIFAEVLYEKYKKKNKILNKKRKST